MGFQSTLPRGERPCENGTMASILAISIHAPTRGATYTELGKIIFINIFQSTLPRGERRVPSRCNQTDGNFNPRSHEGSDDKLLSSGLYCIDISIHAPTRGATVDHAVVHKQYKISIHAPTRGATILIFF